MKDFRIVEELDNGDEVITYFTVEEYDDGYYYVYNDNEVGPFPTLDDAVEGASADLVPTWYTSRDDVKSALVWVITLPPGFYVPVKI